MANILNAICNIINHKEFKVRPVSIGRNRANSMGDSLESYVKDAFAGTLGLEEGEFKLNAYSKLFSWLGSQNNPPDIMLRNGDAIEVKKTQSRYSSLALNSSYPKATLNNNSTMITSECRACEKWTEKDLIYCVGHTSDNSLNSLWMVYGSIYAAKHEIYERIKRKISEGVKEIPNIVFSQTKELGRVNQVDPLGITNLRIRGMWQIENPRKVFDYLIERKNTHFDLVCIIPLTKYNSFSKNSRVKLESAKNVDLTIRDKKVKDPNNPAKLISCKLIRYSV